MTRDEAIKKTPIEKFFDVLAERGMTLRDFQGLILTEGNANSLENILKDAGLEIVE